MKSIVTNNEKNILVEIIQQCPINEEQIDFSCVIIYGLLKNMNTIECLNRYHKLLERAMCHPSPRIKSMVLMLLNDMINSENVTRISVGYPGLLIQAANCLGSSERSVAQGAITLLTSFGLSPPGLKVLYSDMIMQRFKEAMLINDIVRFRVYEIVATVSRKSEDGLKASQATGFMNSLLSEVQSTDTLLQLNALEILSSLGGTAHGYKYLQESGIIQYLIDKIVNLEDEPLSFVVLPGLIEFFGNICKVDPQQFFNSHPEVIHVLFQSLESADEVLMGVIFSTVGKIGSSKSGKIVLSSQRNDMSLFFKTAGEVLKRKNDATVSSLHSLTELFTVPENDNEGVSEILLVWFQQLGPEALNAVIGLSRLPFIELRLSALTFLTAIAKQPWGVERICGYPGMLEYLTDRSTEIHKDCKSAKYDIIYNLTESSNIGNVVGDETLTRLKDFVKEGPYFVPTLSPEVVTEGAS
ncbi:UNVERIFIED_CONTAM: hypothetical protein PYX00_007551 [Menopon gallinae]|uniref:26S proteasome non-ATPase regulatory subunit 5 n=1 Tax=Menopon gallinae TaxID=328185 RepID=A0AAW2HJS2_9NEOP